MGALRTRRRRRVLLDGSHNEGGSRPEPSTVASAKGITRGHGGGEESGTVEDVSSVERLRYVARAGTDVSPGSLGIEASYALAELAVEDPMALLPACRRLLERQSWCGPLWWVAARVLSATDPQSEAFRSAELLEEDLSERLDRPDWPPGERVAERADIAEIASSSLAVVEASAISLRGQGVVLTRRGNETRRIANDLGVPVWVRAGIGRALPEKLWMALSTRASASVLPMDGIEKVIAPEGVLRVEDLELTADCPEPQGLLGRW